MVFSKIIQIVLARSLIADRKVQIFDFIQNSMYAVKIGSYSVRLVLTDTNRYYTIEWMVQRDMTVEHCCWFIRRNFTYSFIQIRILRKIHSLRGWVWFRLYLFFIFSSRRLNKMITWFQIVQKEMAFSALVVVCFSIQYSIQHSSTIERLPIWLFFEGSKKKQCFQHANSLICVKHHITPRLWPLTTSHHAANGWAWLRCIALKETTFKSTQFRFSVHTSSSSSSSPSISLFHFVTWESECSKRMNFTVLLRKKKKLRVVSFILLYTKQLHLIAVVGIANTKSLYCLIRYSVRLACMIWCSVFVFMLHQWVGQLM